MHRTRRANTLQRTRFDPTLRNTIADYHTRYRVRAWHATRPATLGNDFQLSFASSVRRVAFLDRNLGNVLLRIVIVGPMQYARRIEYISCRRRDVDAGACIFRSIDALVRPDAFPGVTDWNSVSRCENFLATTRDTEPSSLFFFFLSGGVRSSRCAHAIRKPIRSLEDRYPLHSRGFLLLKTWWNLWALRGATFQVRDIRNISVLCMGKQVK